MSRRRFRKWGWFAITGVGLCLAPACSWRRGEVLGDAELPVSQIPQLRPAETPYHAQPVAETSPEPPTAPALQPVELCDESKQEETFPLSVHLKDSPFDLPVTLDTSLTPPPESPLVRALQCYLDKRPAEAVAHLAELDQANQELLLSLLPVLVRLTEISLLRLEPIEAAALAAQLEAALIPLRRRAPLTIDAMCCCRRIDKFGVYDPLPADYAYRPGDLVYVYVQLGNLTDAPSDGSYRVRLRSSVRICNKEGQEVSSRDFQEADHGQPSRSPRHDFFYNYWFTLPKLPPGLYTLTVEVTDLPTARVARKSIELRVGEWLSRS